MPLYCFAKVNCGYKPPELVDTSDPKMFTFKFNDFVGNTCASGEEMNAMTFLILPLFFIAVCEYSFV
jgi:hypothetical protein